MFHFFIVLLFAVGTALISQLYHLIQRKLVIAPVIYYASSICCFLLFFYRVFNLIDRVFWFWTTGLTKEAVRRCPYGLREIVMSMKYLEASGTFNISIL